MSSRLTFCNGRAIENNRRYAVTGNAVISVDEEICARIGAMTLEGLKKALAADWAPVDE